MVNFIHMIEPKVLKDELSMLLKKNDVNMFVLDTFQKNQGTEYHYSHDGRFLFDGKYELRKKSRGFKASSAARRYVEYWEKKERLS